MLSFNQACKCVHPGWRDLLLQAYRALPPGAGITEVKEKYGLLRMYFDYERPKYVHLLTYEKRYYAFRALIKELEEQSASICEMCGQPGRLCRLGGWWSVRCKNDGGY